METIITKEESKRIAQIKGRVRGVGIKNIAEFIRNEEGEDGIKKLQESITKVGFPIDYSQMRNISFYPLRLLHITLIGIKKLFNYKDEKFQEMGVYQVKTSMMLRLFSKYLLSLEKAAQEVQKMWRAYFNVGKIEVTEINQEKGQAKIKLSDFPLHPLHAQFLLGYFATVLRMIVKTDTSCKKISSSGKDNGTHEFLLEWENE